MAKLSPTSIIILLVVVAAAIGGIYLYSSGGFSQLSQEQGQEQGKAESESEALTPKPETNDATQFGLSIPLLPRGDSKQRGGADIVEIEKQIRVSIQLENTPGVSQPAHLYSGSCDTLGEIVFPLNSVVDGSSTTTLNVSREEFRAQLPLVINVHKSKDELGVRVVCGAVLEK